MGELSPQELKGSGASDQTCVASGQWLSGLTTLGHVYSSQKWFCFIWFHLVLKFFYLKERESMSWSGRGRSREKLQADPSEHRDQLGAQSHNHEIMT